MCYLVQLISRTITSTKLHIILCLREYVSTDYIFVVKCVWINLVCAQFGTTPLLGACAVWDSDLTWCMCSLGHYALTWCMPSLGHCPYLVHAQFGTAPLLGACAVWDNALTWCMCSLGHCPYLVHVEFGTTALLGACAV